MISTREQDMKVEREVAAFLDKNLYSNKELFTEFIRTDGYDEQIKGSDIIVSTTDKKLYRKYGITTEEQNFIKCVIRDIND